LQSGLTLHAHCFRKAAALVVISDLHISLSPKFVIRELLFMPDYCFSLLCNQNYE